MILTREQFDVLVALALSSSALDQSVLAKLTGYDCRTISQITDELVSKKYIENYNITEEGLAALEPYRVKRAIFIAAGFGKRLIPITLNTPKPLVRVHGIRIIDRLIDACLSAGINEIYIVRGYLGELFDQLSYKYPMIKFLENPVYNEANNISSSLVARYLLSNAYVFEADLLINNPKIIKKYHYSSDFLAIKKDKSDDWCFKVKDGIIIEEKVGGEGDDIWQMVGISYWDENDGKKLSQDIADIYKSPGGKEKYWEQVPLVYRKENYAVEVMECFDEDIVEIDTFDELKAIDEVYNV
ncbi:sugar phosphate nucleotidyltransferase [Sporofaciens sp. JLR.KK001]|uniref:sugar phosphate nucleotidyltransferase n=1 Tax=Sporofaciens sp. JLR.KK001 TaxID=3112621 RepID=UPI002FEF430C